MRYRRYGLLAAALLAGCASEPVNMPMPLGGDGGDGGDIESFSELSEAFAALPPGRSLVVFDLDNTLLTMNDYLGGVAWYDWQQLLEETEEIKEPGEIEDELAVQGILYASRDMSLTEPGVPELVTRLQDRGVDVVVLTARGPAFRSATLDQLERNGIRIDRIADCGPPLCARRGVVDAAAVEALAVERFGDERLLALQFNSGRPLSAGNGVVMLAGQRKGIALVLLLDSLPARYEQVIMIDDSATNVTDVNAVAPEVRAALRVYRYTRYDEKVEAFMDSTAEQRAVTEQWERIRTALCEDAKAPSWCSRL